MNNKIMGLALVASMVFSFCTVNAQSTSPNKANYNRLGLGLHLNHMYDLKFNAYDDLQNGFSGEDMRGLNGDNTRFDLAYGLDISYQFSPVLAVDLYGMFGSMTGANQIEYYKSQFRSVGVGSNISLKTSNAKTYRFVPYVRFATGWSSFDATRFFVLDNVDFSSEEGSTWHYNLGLGLNAYLTNNFSFYLQSVFNVVSTDAWDGYNYGSGRDQMLQTTVGFRYTLGSKKRLHLNREAAWQGVTDKEVYDGQEILRRNLKILDERVDELVANQLEYQTTTDSALSNLYDSISPETLEALIDARIQKYYDQLSLGELYAVYFEFNSAVINTAGQGVLQEVAKLLVKNPNMKIALSTYSDPIGNESANQEIRDARKEMVKAGLVNLGVSLDQLAFEVWSGVYTGNNQLDRRVELRIMK